MPSSSKQLVDTNLFKPIKLGSVTLQNRFVHAPTTRFRNTDDHVATDSMLEYYTERATNNGGLIITEATSPAPDFGMYPNSPMIYTPSQVKAWKKIVDSVHSKGSFVASQLWHLGAASDPKLLKDMGLPLVSSTGKYPNETFKKSALAADNKLRALTLDEIEVLKERWVEAAKRAVFEAGFDFVELHSAHGYLLDQFLQEVVNDRTDKYGGSIENRSRLLLELVDLLIEAIGAERVAVRLSPYSEYQGSGGVDSPNVHPISQFGYVLGQLEKRAKEGNRLGYISIVEPRVQGNDNSHDTRSFNTSWISEIWKGDIIRSGAYLNDVETGYSKLKNDVDADDRTLIGSARYFTSNPDLVDRLRKGLALTHYDRPTFYTQFTNVGYLTWQKYGEEQLPRNGAIALKVPEPLA